MLDLAMYGIVLFLIIGVGARFAVSPKSSASSLRLQWMGYTVLLMSILLIAFAILHYMSEAAHGHGH